MQTKEICDPTLLLPGDMIFCSLDFSGKVMKCFVIKEVISQDFWGRKDPEKPYKDYGYYVEFIDTEGHYHYWKEQYDGGFVRKREE